MKSWPVPLFLGILSLICGGAVAPAAAAKSAGNCLECHSQKFTFNGSSDFYRAAGIENRLVYQSRLHPCPGIKILSEETFHTESRLVQVNRLAAEAGGEGTSAAAWRRKAGEIGDSFNRLKDEGGLSGSRFARGAAVLRGGLQKIYDQAFESRAESGRKWLIGIAGILLIAAALLAGIGYRKLGRFGKTVLFAALLCGSLSLSACSPEAGEKPSKSTAQEGLDQARAIAGKLTARAEDQFATAILLAETAGDWARLDAESAGKAFQLAWRLALRGREEGAQIAPLRKVAEQWPNPAEAARQKVNFDQVLDLRDDLKALEGRTWALRAVAEEWIRGNPQKGREALEFAVREARSIRSGDVRDIELKALAEAWAGIDPEAAVETARGIQDPFLKSVSLAGIAGLLKEKEKAAGLFAEAWKLMETIPPGPLKIHAWAKISAAAGAALREQKGAWADQARARVKELKDPLMQAFALQELAASWAGKDWEQAERFAKEIPAARAEARAFALIGAGTGGNIPAEKAAGILKSALEEAGRIEDGFLAQKATARVLAAMAAQAPREAGRHLPRLQDPLLRSEVEAVLTERMADQNPEEALKVSGHIPGEFQRARAVLKILNRNFPRDVEAANSLFHEAKKAGGSVSEPYSRALFLADLGRSWGRIDRAREAAVYEEALIVCKDISSPSLKAEALESLSSAWKNSDKARAQAALEAIDPAVFRAREMAAEVKLWARTDFGKARQAAESIPGNFPVEKAQALKELGAAVKKVQPALGIEVFEKALASAMAIPEGGSKEKILTQILGEAASLDADKALAMAQTVSDREMKDRLLKETGMGLTKDESQAALSGALKIAKAISESSLRTPVYQKAADRLAKGPAKGNGADPALLAALSAWGKAREAARQEETEAAPVFERALAEIGKISDAKERAFVLAAMIGDFAQAEEGRALKAAETIAPDMAEARSYGLLQAGVQFRKWSRKEAEGVFE